VTIRKLAADGCTVLLSSHLLAEVEQICDRVGVIHRGRLVTETTVADLRDGGTLRIVADGEVIDLDVDRDQAARINAEFVTAGMAVSELRWREPDLEQIFLRLTGANDDD